MGRDDDNDILGFCIDHDIYQPCTCATRFGFQKQKRYSITWVALPCRKRKGKRFLFCNGEINNLAHHFVIDIWKEKEMRNPAGFLVNLISIPMYQRKCIIYRRCFFLATFCLVCISSPYLLPAQSTTAANNGLAERKYCIEVLLKIADPVLQALAKNELRKLMPVESVKGSEEDRKNYTYLEATGRLLAGMAPWLELGPDETAEGKLRKKYIDLAVMAIRNATDSLSPDHMNFIKGEQPLVDAAFLAQALVRAPSQLWDNLDKDTKCNVIRELKNTRRILPYYSNWLLFSAMIEAALLKFDHSGDRMRIDYAVKQHMNWYKGDGMYGDGPDFHWDYYNSFVIQPMLLAVLQELAAAGFPDKKTYDAVLKRAQRYAAIQERLISPEGTYPPIGRSLAYRFGAFQLLADISKMKLLPKEISPQQVRFALYTMIKRQVQAPGTFDTKGWLQIGLYGHQPNIGEGYISTGSLYLCSQVFVMLGLPETDPFWTVPDEDWSQRKIWNGKPIPIDHAIEYP